ncbi:MAG: ATPase F1F0 subunit gamma [Gloeocapsa sp. DLM2.Bin57]|nr:MAG: ATPase F1F0 subunit gamma [Gloeocapsa sp. DLM2.Bin57]
MPSLETWKRKIETVEDLQLVVKTMKALAAVNIHQYEKAVNSLIEYERTLTMGIQILLKNHPQALLSMKAIVNQRLAVVVFGSDQGMCGQFNEKITQFTLDNLESVEYPWVLTIGGRISDRLEAKGYQSQLCLRVPSSLTGITTIVQEIVITLEDWLREKQINQIWVFYNQFQSGVVYHPEKVQIFPLNLVWLRELQRQKWVSSTLPMITLPPKFLASALFRQYFFVCLYRACAESLASENASRLASMQAAEKNITERLTELQAQFQHQRQTNITEELLDIIAGFEALSYTSI